MIILPILLSISVMCVSPSYLKHLITINGIIGSPNETRLLSFNMFISFSSILISYPSSESVVFVLFISRYVVFWVSFIPPELIFFMCWYIYILKKPSRGFRGWCSISCFCKRLWKWLLLAITLRKLLLSVTLGKGVCCKDTKTNL